MGRPSKHHLLPKICDQIRSGMPIKMACATSGVGYTTLRTWCADEERNGEASTYAGTVMAIEQAKAESVSTLLASIHKAARDDWKAAAWILERRFPEDFAKVQRLTGVDGGPVQIEVQAEARAAERILERLRGAAPERERELVPVLR